MEYVFIVGLVLVAIAAIFYLGCIVGRATRSESDFEEGVECEKAAQARLPSICRDFGIKPVLACILVLFLYADSYACDRCGLFGNRCRFVAHHAAVVTPAAIVKQPEVFVINNGYPAANTAPQGTTVYGYQQAAQAYTVDPAALLQQAANLAIAANTTAVTGINGYNSLGQLQLQLQAGLAQPLVQSQAAQAVLNAAGIGQPVKQSQPLNLRIYQDGSGNWQVDSGVQAPQALFGWGRATANQPSQGATATAKTPEANVPPAAPLPAQTLLAQKCGSCHGTQLATPKKGLYIDGTQKLECETILASVKAVRSGAMPKGETLSAEDKEALVTELLNLGR